MPLRCPQSTPPSQPLPVSTCVLRKIAGSLSEMDAGAGEDELDSLLPEMDAAAGEDELDAEPKQQGNTSSSFLKWQGRSVVAQRAVGGKGREGGADLCSSRVDALRQPAREGGDDVRQGGGRTACVRARQGRNGAVGVAQRGGFSKISSRI